MKRLFPPNSFEVAITKEIAQLVASYIQQRPTLVFAAIRTCRKTYTAFCHLGFSAQTVSGKQTRTEREHTLCTLAFWFDSNCVQLFAARPKALIFPQSRL